MSRFDSVGARGPTLDGEEARNAEEQVHAGADPPGAAASGEWDIGGEDLPKAWRYGDDLLSLEEAEHRLGRERTARTQAAPGRESAAEALGGRLDDRQVAERGPRGVHRNDVPNGSRAASCCRCVVTSLAGPRSSSVRVLSKALEDLCRWVARHRSDAVGQFYGKQGTFEFVAYDTWQRSENAGQAN